MAIRTISQQGVSLRESFKPDVSSVALPLTILPVRRGMRINGQVFLSWIVLSGAEKGFPEK